MDNSSILLDSQQLHVIAYIAKNSLLETLRRRARLLIAYNQGQTTALAAAQAGLSRGRTRFWRHQFKMKGMDIFPEMELAKVQVGIPVEVIEIDQVGCPEEPKATELKNSFPETEATDSSANLLEISEGEGLEPILLLERMQAPGVVATDPIAEAGRKVMAFHFAEMLSHEEGTRKGEISEELHDMRVATRRMRAAFDIFNDAFDPNAIRRHLKGLKATGRALGRVRDMDVFIEKAIVYQQNLPEEQRPGLEPLIRNWIQERELDRAQLLGHLDSPRYLEFKRRFIKFLQTEGSGARLDANIPNGQLRVRDFAPVIIYNRLASVRAFDALLSNASLDQLHALRIEFKKLRYAVEFFREVLGKQVEEVISDLKILQDHLGELNDARVAIQMISQFIEEWETRQAQLPLFERQSPEPIVAFLGSKHAERYHLMVTFPETWTMFNRPEFRQNLALAIAVL